MSSLMGHNNNNNNNSYTVHPVEIGRTFKVKQLREGAVTILEEMLASKMEEVAVLQEQLAMLSKHHVLDTAMVDPYGDSGVFTGQVHQDKPHGKGMSCWYSSYHHIFNVTIYLYI